MINEFSCFTGQVLQKKPKIVGAERELLSNRGSPAAHLQ